jgi:hypothetical protein
MLTGIVLSVIKKLWKNADKIKLGLLVKMLLAGSLILAIEHVWHGEIVPYPPFLTAMQNSSDIPVLINEMTVIGGSMTIVVTATWSVVVAFAKRVEVKVRPPTRIISTLDKV